MKLEEYVQIIKNAETKNKDLAEIHNKFMRTKTIVEGIHFRSKEETDAKFSDLYSLLHRVDFIVQALTTVRLNKGIDTLGTNGKGLDGFGMDDITTLAKELKEQEYAPKPVRRVYVPKPGKTEKRPLGIPNLKDKLVQWMIKEILEAIYEPEFERHGNDNHGFRKKKSVRTAMDEMKLRVKGLQWCIEGDISKAYDTIDHETLMNILRRKTEDRKFLKLIREMLKAGYDEKGISYSTEIGTPQGGIVSPTLFNIYLFEFDKYIRRKLGTIEPPDNKTRVKKKYREISSKIYNHGKWIKRREEKYGKAIIKWPEKELEERSYREARIKELTKERMKIIPTDSKISRFRYHYVRYADDWILIMNGKYEKAKETKEEIANFLEKQLKMELSREKTKITNLHTGSSNFLGFNLKYNWTHRRIRKGVHGTLKRTTGIDITVGVDTGRIEKRMKVNGFMTEDGKTKSKVGWTALSKTEIIDNYNARIRGLMGYWSQGIDKSWKVEKWRFYLENSYYKTLAHKFRSTVNKMAKKEKQIRETGKEKTIMNYEETKQFFEKCKRTNASYSHMWSTTKANWRTAYKLNKVCVICGDPGPLEMHHIKHLKKAKATGFTKVMIALKRKQIPVCKECHKKIHAGTYNGTPLKELYSERVARL